MRAAGRATVAAVVVGVLAAPAYGWGHRVRAAYYYPAPAYYVPAAPVAVAVPVVPAEPCPAPGPAAPLVPVPQQPGQLPAVPNYAPASPAPPSGAPMVPSTPGSPGPRPGVTESRSHYDAYAARASERPAGAAADVGFWNLTARDITLTVDGTSRVVAPGRDVRLPLGRQFVWQVDAREPQTERLPAGAPGVEIVIRR